MPLWSSPLALLEVLGYAVLAMGERGGKARGKASVVGQRPPSGTMKGEGSGRSTPVRWTQHTISDAEVDALRKQFTKVSELPGDRICSARRNWQKLAVIVRSTGRRVPAEWVAKDVGSRGRLGYEVDSFPIAEDHLVLRFQTEEDRDKALTSGPWFVAGQLLAMEPWRPDFVPGPDVVKDSVVWLRLPKLPLEFWDQESIRRIAAEAGQPMVVDDFTGQLTKMGFARVKVLINSVEPLVPGIQIQGESRIFWLPFVYENIPSFCYRCGRLGHETEGCQHLSPVLEAEEGRRATPMVVETTDALGLDGGRGQALERQSVYGPWLATTRIRQPPTLKTPPPPKTKSGSNPDPSRLGGLRTSPATPLVPSSPPDSPPDSAGWQKPTKLARRRSPTKLLHLEAGGASASVFNPLTQAGLQEA